MVPRDVFTKVAASDRPRDFAKTRTATPTLGLIARTDAATRRALLAHESEAALADVSDA